MISQRVGADPERQGLVLDIEKSYLQLEAPDEFTLDNLILR